jgi:hypothetical protein
MARKKITLAHILTQQKLQDTKKHFSRQKVTKAATELGREGGKVGGPARAKALTADRRHQIAVHAICARWGIECLCSKCQKPGGT